jgi:8-oxo-dGTP pyrophosphatase MutT (NUDIX family)
MAQEKSVGAVIYRKENDKIYYLLLKYKEKHWDFVKGHIEPNETEEQTLLRETEEEAGLLDLKIAKGFREYFKYVFRQYKEKMSKEDLEKGKIAWIFKIVIFYLAETKTKEIKLSPEHQDYKWLIYEEAIKQTTFKNAKELLKKANNFIIKNNL